jgi:hypothetical protein
LFDIKPRLAVCCARPDQDQISDYCCCYRAILVEGGRTT